MNYSSEAILDAYKVLEGGSLTPAEALALLNTEPPYLMDLYSLADKVRLKFRGDAIDTCEISNAKSGACSENCAFCAQSSRHSTGAAVYPLKDMGALLTEARQAKADGASAFCVVLSGYGHEEPDAEFLAVLDAVRAIGRETGLELHASPGILSPTTARMLKEAGVAVVNHNLETAPSFYPKVCTTHSSAKRMLTVMAVKAAGMKACCGGILGLGEGAEERVELAFALRDLDVDVIPLNIHRKIPGTRLEASPPSVVEALNAVAVFRLVNPAKTIKLAAGRETALADYQGLAFHAGANGMLIGGYLTVKGRSVAADQALLGSLRQPHASPLGK